MKLSEYILSVFAEEKISHAFMVPGGHVDPFMSSFQNCKELLPIVACHEGGAAFMADGYARASGKFGVALGIGGPGITNMMTGLGIAHTDHVPMFVVTGEAKQSIAGRGAFQDSTTEFLNDNAFTIPLLSHKATTTDASLIEYQMQLLMRKMLTHCNRGPVNLSVPSNIARMDGDFSYQPMNESLYFPRFLDTEAASLVSKKINNAVKIAILAGEGVVRSGASESLIKFAEKNSIPVATTLNAKGVIPEDHELSLGVLGWFGNKRAHDVLLRQDLEVLIVLGTRLHQPDCLNWNKKLIPKKCLILNDIDEASPFPNYHADHFILGDAETFLDYLDQINNLQAESFINERKQWLENTVSHIERYYDLENYSSDMTPIHPARIAKELQQVMPKETIIFSGEGAGSFIVSHYWKAYKPRSFFSPIKYMSPMGWSVAAAIGGKLARPDAPVVSLTGDGSMLMHGLEIQTAARYNIPVIFLLMNNSAHGNPQLRAKEVGRYETGFLELPTHDWKKIAECLGLVSFSVTDPKELASTFEKALQLNKTVLIDIRVGNYSTPTYDFDH